jgi:Arf-GAP with Rho-GAP domain, ANK repeat and PH domain-containing protein 1
MISRRKLIFHDYNESSLQVLDLRKARYIGFKNSDDSINQLYVEKGSIIFIDCPPHTCYFIMPNTRETKIWKAIITDEAHTNGSRLHEHQLTKDNVPVLIDKCINFIYTNGKFQHFISILQFL